MKDEKPRPCPFCGRDPEQSDRPSNHTESGRIYFISCRCGGFSAHAHQHADTPDKVLCLWNGRHAGA